MASPLPGLLLTAVDDEPVSLRSLDTRLRRVEARNSAADAEHLTLKATDGQTALAVEKLADTINNPRTGLIVELERFREEVRTDRRVFKAWLAGAAFIVSIIYSIVTIFAPLIRAVFHIPQT